MSDAAAREDVSVDAKRRASPVEEDEVQREAHAEGVDARAARDDEAGPGLVAIEVSEAKQAGAKGRCHGDVAAEDRGNGQAAQAKRQGLSDHLGSRLDRTRFLPPASLF